MSRYNEKKISYSTQDKLMDTFCGALVRLRTKSDARDFLKDLLNRQERLMLIRRLLIAEMLIDGATYRDIIFRLHCGATTIARVERWLHFGRQGYLKAVRAKKRKGN